MGGQLTRRRKLKCPVCGREVDDNISGSRHIIRCLLDYGRKEGILID